MPDSAPNDATFNSRNLFSKEDALRDLDTLIASARSQNASKLLILAGKPIVCRIDGQLSEPILPGRVHFNQTERLVTALLSAEQHVTLDTDGAVEIDYTPATNGNDGTTAKSVRINNFFGDGAHNLVVFLDSQDR